MNVRMQQIYANRDIFGQKSENGGCFTHLISTNCQFLCFLKYTVAPVVLRKL